jgi:3-carboxy-cis,cis-muconate cycloisomerase
LTSSGLFTGLFVPDDVRAATSDRAWVQAMLDAEAALAAAEAGAGIVPVEAARAIAAACDADRFDPDALGREARSVGNPAAPLAKALASAVPDEAGRFVHWGATSQDIMDTAAMLVAHRTLGLVDGELRRVARACAGLAERHRDTPMVGRTLLQQALPITFGLKAAGWLAAVAEARERLATVPLAAELGGAAGTLASLGSDGVRVLALFAEELGLEEPVMPWHTARARVAELGAALAIAAGALEKIALDVTLLAQTEVGEVAEHSGGGRGGSSTLPHKRNPIGAVLTVACARRVRAGSVILLEAMAQEHERAAGAWHSEWEALTETLAYTGGAAASLGEVLEGLEVRVERMRANLDRTGGLLMAESVTMALAGRVGRPRAKQLVEDASRRAVEAGRPLRDELVEDEAVAQALSPEEIDRALDPEHYRGSAEAFVDRALARYAEDAR